MALRSECAEAVHKEIMAILWDLKKAFDYVRWSQLLAQAGSEGYPIYLLCVSVWQYMWPRMLTMANHVTDELYATHGVTAGAVAAMFDLKLLLLPLIRAHGEEHPHIELLIHVDDLCQAAEDTTVDGVFQLLDESAQGLKKKLYEAGMVLADDKEQGMASSKEGAEKLSQQVEKRIESRAKLLGVEW